jgi:hypothetical protein
MERVLKADACVVMTRLEEGGRSVAQGPTFHLLADLCLCFLFDYTIDIKIGGGGGRGATHNPLGELNETRGSGPNPEDSCHVSCHDPTNSGIGSCFKAIPVKCAMCWQATHSDTLRSRGG